MSELKEVHKRKIKDRPKTLEWNILNDKKLCLVDITDKYSIHGCNGFIEYSKEGRMILVYNSNFESFNSSDELNKRLKKLKLPTIDDGVSSAFSILSDTEHKR